MFYNDPGHTGHLQFPVAAANHPTLARLAEIGQCHFHGLMKSNCPRFISGGRE